MYICVHFAYVWPQIIMIIIIFYIIFCPLFMYRVLPIKYVDFRFAQMVKHFGIFVISAFQGTLFWRSQTWNQHWKPSRIGWWLKMWYVDLVIWYACSVVVNIKSLCILTSIQNLSSSSLTVVWGYILLILTVVSTRF